MVVPTSDLNEQITADQDCSTGQKIHGMIRAGSSHRTRELRSGAIGRVEDLSLVLANPPT